VLLLVKKGRKFPGAKWLNESFLLLPLH
jgi:hypothetical protein